ncbi:uroporphyrinogen-III C-methyltransferase [Terricaulis silvestris]|uniref:uroporphyrinogen-III C-methyltransferase n=1 Tax=Terricaulis silvestris TaxID=2686094 RepID=A0A6I6MX80_9CAUL|nr:uroporphyrinogen-III C-methyltransferase [Terricaulis silvestris]QGZ96232.1 Siroheme synthase [Terricaulis silvestris]
MSGAVYLVGAGPGAADLLTVRAARLLGQADVVVHDALIGAEVLALAPQAKLYNVGKRANRPSVDQRFICRLLVRLAGRHGVVVRLKGGDPNLFGRATEETRACRAAGVPVVSVPGISAGFAAASSLGVSLTARGVSRSVAFVTPTVARDGVETAHWAEAAAAAETAVIYMGALQAERVRDALLARGVPAHRPVALVESASLVGERIVRGALHELVELARELGEGPAIMVIGEAVAEARAVIAAADAA